MAGLFIRSTINPNRSIRFLFSRNFPLLVWYVVAATRKSIRRVPSLCVPKGVWPSYRNTLMGISKIYLRPTRTASRSVNRRQTRRKNRVPVSTCDKKKNELRKSDVHMTIDVVFFKNPITFGNTFFGPLIMYLNGTESTELLRERNTTTFRNV